jgi:hypothetical protein
MVSSKLSIIAATAAILMIAASASAEPAGGRGGGPGGGPGIVGGGPGIGGGGPGVRGGGNVNRNFNGGRPVVGRQYHGGVWYGTGRRFWRGQWYPYGVGPCWLLSPIGYVWICG